MAQLSSSQHRTLTALAETALPAGKYLPAAGAATVAKVESFLDQLPDALTTGAGGLLAALDAAALVRHARRFASLSPEKRLALLEGWRTGDPIRRLMLRALVAPLKMAHFDDPELYRKLGCVYETQKVKAEAKPAYLRDRVHAQLGGDLAVEVDVVVVGTGAGGAVVGRELAEAGLAANQVEKAARSRR